MQDKTEKLLQELPYLQKVVANLLTNAGANRIVTVDLHAGQIQGFFDMPVDNLFTTPLFSKFIKKISSKNLICVSPDMGGVAEQEL